jgi:pimeloyl-ACP methyl ester carboxylesterase
MQALRNVVLVHGAWADGSSWSKIIPLIQAVGLHVACAQNPLSSIADDVASTNRIIDVQDGPVLLVGHSYGGAIITICGDNPKVRGLVYVAAFAPDEGETLEGMAQPFGPTPGLGELRPIADGYLLLTAKGIIEDFAQDLSWDQKNNMVATQAPTHGSILATKLTKAAWHTKPSWFVIADNDRMISPEQERMTAKRMNAKTLSLPTSHVPMLAKPKEVAEFIVDAVASLGGPEIKKLGTGPSNG